MKCPKCQFTSFDYLDNCKKCGAELSELKNNLNILSVVPRVITTDRVQTILDTDIPEEQGMIDTMDTSIQSVQDTLGNEQTLDHEIEGQEGVVLEDSHEIDTEDKNILGSPVDLNFEDTIEENPSLIEEELEEETAEKGEEYADILKTEISNDDEVSEVPFKLETEESSDASELALDEEGEEDADILKTEISIDDEVSEIPFKLETEESSDASELSLEEGMEEFVEEKDTDDDIELELPEFSKYSEISIGMEDIESLDTYQSEEGFELSPLEIDSKEEISAFPEKHEEDTETVQLDPESLEIIEFEEEEPSSDEELK
ncbi:MAG: hypothetical protein ABIJ37_08725 [Pseudomonadota bacterium]